MREEIYIINVGGSVLFHFCPLESSVNQKLGDDTPHLFASFLTAILQFAKALNRDEVSNFEMGKTKIVITQSTTNQLYYVIISDGKDTKRTKMLETHINNIRKSFEEKYTPEQITNWDGNTEAFSDFKLVIDKNFKRNIEDFFNNF